MTDLSCRAYLKITEAIISSIIDEKPIKQQIIELLSNFLNVERCVVFKIFRPEKVFCQMVAGVPEEEEHHIGVIEPLGKHPDIEKVTREQKILLISNPKNSPLTAYFQQIIISKNINQILYVPLLFRKNSRRTIGVIVIDASSKKKEFTKGEIEFCSQVGELISLLIEQEDILIEKMRDRIFNRIVSLGGFAKRLEKLSGKIQEHSKVIADEIKSVEEVFSKGKKSF